MDESNRPGRLSGTDTPHGSRALWWETTSAAGGATSGGGGGHHGVRASSIATSAEDPSAASGHHNHPFNSTTTHPHHHHHAGGGGSSSFITAVQRVSEQCESRSLDPTSQWLGELLLAASPSLLSQTSTGYPIIAPDVPLDGTTKTLATLGRQLLRNREYARCHHLLKGVLTNVVDAATTAHAAGSASAAAGVHHPQHSRPPPLRTHSGGHLNAHPSFFSGVGRSLSSIRPASEVDPHNTIADWEIDTTHVGDIAAALHLSGHSETPSATHRTSGGGSVVDPHNNHHHNPNNHNAAAMMQPHHHRAPRLSDNVEGGGVRLTIGTVDGASPIPPVAAVETAGAGGGTTAAAAGAGGATSSTGASSSVLVFLALYAMYMEGQQHQRAQSSPIAARTQPNPNLRTLRLLLQPTVEHYPTDSYLLWLYAIVLRESQLKQEAATLLIQAVRLNPLLWCAWQDLGTLVAKEAQLGDIANALRGPTRADALLLFAIFSASVRSDLGYHTAAALEWESLLVHFPTSSFIKCHLGSCLYHRKDFDGARTVYEEVRAVDPYRLEGTDEYSNVLFVRGDRVALSHLAQQCYPIDPYRAETNCIVGNYYAMVSRHEKSLFHFRRAVTIDPLYLSGWTLMGHEYLEVKNTNAAVEAYRAAIEIDQRDYRAWYGLGQIYELLHMHHHALYYYWQTTSLRPTDPRMWSAVANCLDQEGRSSEAVSCLERAEQYEPTVSDHYPALVRRIAEYYLNESRHTRGSSVGGGIGAGGQGGHRQAPPSKQPPPAPGTHRYYTSRALTYLEKLIASERRKTDDVLFAVPSLVESRLEEVHQCFSIPTRSPSFDPSLGSQQHQQRNSGALGSGGDQLLREVQSTLEACEGYLNVLLRSIPLPSHGGGGGFIDPAGASHFGDGATAPTATTGSDHTAAESATTTPETMFRAQTFVTQAQSGIAYIRAFLGIASLPTDASEGCQ